MFEQTTTEIYTTQYILWWHDDIIEQKLNILQKLESDY